MSTHNIPILIQKRKHPKLSQICSCGIFSKGLKNEFEIAVVNEPSVFELLKFYCMYSKGLLMLKNDQVRKAKESDKNNLTITPKSQAHLQTMRKKPAKFQNDHEKL